uniref:Uncharacterized protein n=1 Tax=Pygocentrus nattereri TaxID=42514 RepID=A0A3B4C7H4_PYGNA
QELLPSLLHISVVGIHVQFLRVQHTELGVGGLDVVQVLHGSVQPTHDGLTVSSHFRVAHDSRGAGEVTKGREVPLSPGSHDQKYHYKHRDDGAALGICPLNHADGLGSLHQLCLTACSLNPLLSTETRHNLSMFNVSALQTEHNLIGSFLSGRKTYVTGP